MNNNVASRILRLMDPAYRRKLLILEVAVLLVLFYLHTFANRWTSPLALIPRTFTAISMGWFLFHIISIIKFPLVLEYFDTAKLTRSAQQGAEPDAGTGRKLTP